MRELEQATGVNRETVRVFLRLGLIPAPVSQGPRTADYDDTHVRAINAVRSLQREQGLSLEQIRKAMAGDVASFPRRASGYQHLDELVAARLGIDNDMIPVTAVLPRNPLALSDAPAMRRVGAIDVKTIDGQPHVTRGDAQMLALWGNMRAAGFQEKFGFSPKQLKIYVEHATALAKWEIETFVALAEGAVEEDAAAGMVLNALSDMLGCFALIRTKVALRELAKKRTAASRRKPGTATKEQKTGAGE
ncbi:MerR family transcriptional regulator [Novosphingobium lentum]|uniref:MerR family transcriptional regulator n=1 Tax=Novosphingobium lentum TaxID=145287 RepID=UPI001FDECE37|nr:MerR family transcriptional regulator [Novosphingobium lentum]